jgi:hypothetical protein
VRGSPAYAGRPIDEYADVVEYLRVFGHVGFFSAARRQRRT